MEDVGRKCGRNVEDNYVRKKYRRSAEEVWMYRRSVEEVRKMYGKSTEEVGGSVEEVGKRRGGCT